MKLLTLGEKLGKPECPYLIRWILNLVAISFRLHHWIFGDDPRAKHNHPCWLITFVLWGSYTDVSLDANGNETREEMTPGTIRFRPARHIHTVDVHKGGCWTFVIMGPITQKWGFFVRRKLDGAWKFVKSNKYFIENGHHPCQ